MTTTLPKHTGQYEGLATFFRTRPQFIDPANCPLPDGSLIKDHVRIGKIKTVDGEAIFGIMYLAPPFWESWCWPSLVIAERTAWSTCASLVHARMEKEGS